MNRRSSKAKLIALLAILGSFGLAFLSFSPKSKSAPRQQSSASAPILPQTHPSALSPSPSALAPSSSALPADSSPGVHEMHAPSLRTIPMGKGLPVNVRVAVRFLEVSSFDDSKKEFEATSDLRMRWVDTRLRYSPKEAIRGYKEFIGKEATERLENMWVPHAEFVNQIEAPTATSRRLRLFPDGTIETISRMTARFKTRVDASKFPFDRQHLTMNLMVREDTMDEVVLDSQADDLDFCSPVEPLTVDGWEPGLVSLRRETVGGWNGEKYSRVVASLALDRDAKSGIGPIFIPLVASLLIPMLAVWMNKPDPERGFVVDAFELANIIIGGLFSVIALSFAIYTSYGVIAGGDNTVTRLFALNYITLSVSLLVVILFFRFNLPRRVWGGCVQEYLFHFICWAMPLLTLATGLAVLLLSAA